MLVPVKVTVEVDVSGLSLVEAVPRIVSDERESMPVP